MGGHEMKRSERWRRKGKQVPRAALGMTKLCGAFGARNDKAM